MAKDQLSFDFETRPAANAGDSRHGSDCRNRDKSTFEQKVLGSAGDATPRRSDERGTGTSGARLSWPNSRPKSGRFSH